LISRQPIKGFYSIEKVFNGIIPHIQDYTVVQKILPFSSGGIFGMILNLLFLRRFREGIFHVTGHAHYGVLALPRQRTVLTIHDLIFLNAYSGLKKKVMRWFYLDMPVKWCRYITTVSEKTKTEILFHVNCNPDKIRVIPNPVSDAMLPEESAQKRIVPVVLFIGTTPNKNLEYAIPALHGIKLHLRIIGQPSQSVLGLLDKFSIDYSFDKYLDEEEVIREYANADILLFPSHYEGFGLPIIEAFKYGVPVVTSDISPMADIAGNAALLVDPNSIVSIRKEVLRLIELPDLRASLRMKGRERVVQYQAANIARLYQDLYASIADFESP
jgi:glycosyltransferase involved in cell wall biosynthesis